MSHALTQCRASGPVPGRGGVTGEEGGDETPPGREVKLNGLRESEAVCGALLGTSLSQMFLILCAR